MKYLVKACTWQPGLMHFSESRDEIVDTESNIVFRGCENIRDVEIAYSDFWNFLNSPDEYYSPANKVCVMYVEKI